MPNISVNADLRERGFIQQCANQQHRRPSEHLPSRSRRLATVILANGAMGRPTFTSPGTPSDRVKILREAYEKMLKDPAFVDADRVELESFFLDVGEELEGLVKEVMTQPQEIIDRLKKLLG